MTDESHQAKPQYSLPQVLGIWAAAALPMALLGWVFTPVLAPSIDRSVGIILENFFEAAGKNAEKNSLRS